MYPKKIVGILDCKNKTIYGINKKSNTPLVIFNSYDKSLGKFLVPSKLKYTNKNYYCVIKFNKNDVKYRFPIANLLYTIGEVGDYNAHCEYLLHCYKLNLKEPEIPISKNQKKKLYKTTDIWDLIKKSDLPTYKDHRSIYTFTIDPDTSTDYDDAISLTNNKLGIHIADVSFWLLKYKWNINFFSTIYTPIRKINMIPSVFADNLASLIENKDRLSLTLWIDIDTGSYYYEDTIIRVNKNYSYDNFPVSNFHSIWEISKKFGKQFKMDVNNWDTHKMIESFMVLANFKTAEYLKLHNKKLFRIHDEKEHNIKIWELENKKFRDFMSIYLSNSAKYTIIEGRHYGLNIPLYTHFTSPIRRMADIYVHFLIKEIDLEIEIDLNKCNEDLQLTKQLKRDFEKYDIIQKLTKTIQTEGYVCNYKNGFVTMYFPELDFCDKFHILPSTVRDNKEKFEEQEAKIKLLEKINVIIAKKNDKLIYSF